MTDTRIDISVNERGVKEVTRAIDSLASAAQTLSPRLAKSLRGAALRVSVNTDKLVKQVAVAVLDKVVRTTPVDTGQARGNWQVTISNGIPDVSPHYVAHEPGYADPEGGKTVAAGMATISGQRNPGQTIFISNALPYIQLLNEGSSLQQPAGFVYRGIQAGLKVASNAKILKK